MAASANCEAAIWRSSSMLKYVAVRGTLLIQILPGCSRAPAFPPAHASNNFITTRGLSARAPTEKTSLIICVEQNCVTGTGNCRCARQPASGTVARQRIGKLFGTEIRPPICDQSCGHDDIAEKPAGLAVSRSASLSGEPADSVASSRSPHRFSRSCFPASLRLWRVPPCGALGTGTAVEPGLLRLQRKPGRRGRRAVASAARLSSSIFVGWRWRRL